MNFSKHKFKVFDFIKLSFIVSPINAGLKIINIIISALLPSAFVLATEKFIDIAIGVHSGKYPFGDVYIPIGLLFALVVYQNMNKSLFHFADIKLSFKMQEYIQNQVINKRATLDYFHIENSDDWDLINRVCNEPSSHLLEGYNSLLQLFRIIVSLVSYALIIFTRVWWAAILVVVFTVVLFLLSLKSGQNNYIGYQKTTKYKRYAEYLNKILEEREYVEERTLFSYSDEIEKKWVEQYEKSRKIALGVEAKELLKTKAAGLLAVIVSFIFAGVLMIPLKQSIISIGFYIAIVTALFNVVNIVSWELTSVTNIIANKNEYLKDLSKFFALSSIEDSICLPDVSIRNRFDNSIEFKNVSFAYPGTKGLILKDISFKLNMNQKYAFVGANGAGKTTIIKLLTGLYRNYEGTILIGGQDIKLLSEGEIKALFSIIYQDYAKYQISVFDNIKLGDICNDKEMFLESLTKTIGVSDIVEQLPDGINTKIGKIYESSVDISGGEWQRIAMARALISEAPICILDEPTASLDPIAESKLYHSFQKAMDDKKLNILITHRLGATRFVDEILVVENGTIVERGTHEKLLLRKGVYATMFNEQKGWYEYEEE